MWLNSGHIFLPEKFNKVKLMDWIRGKEIPSIYPIGRTYAYELLRQFTAEADPQNYIKDGRVLIVRQESFEDWWRNRGKDK